MSEVVRLLHSDDLRNVADGILQAGSVMASGEASVDLAAIRQSLVMIIEADPPHIQARSAVWALSKQCDPQLRPIFVSFLLRAVQHYHLGDVWQATCALGDCGVASMQVSGSVLDFDKNYARAVDFLRQEGAV